MKKHYSVKKNIDDRGYWAAYSHGWIVVDQNGETWGGRGFYTRSRDALRVADILNQNENA